MIPFGYILFEKTPGQNIKGKPIIITRNILIITSLKTIKSSVVNGRPYYHYQIQAAFIQNPSQCMSRSYLL